MITASVNMCVAFGISPLAKSLANELVLAIQFHQGTSAFSSPPHRLSGSVIGWWLWYEVVRMKFHGSRGVRQVSP